MTPTAQIEWTFLRDADDNYAPAEKPMLRMHVIDDLVSFAIVNYDETSEGQKFTEVAQIVVDLEPFIAALNAHTQSRREKPASAGVSA